MSTYDIQMQIEEHYDSFLEECMREIGTAYAEPAVEQEPDEPQY